MVIAQSASRKVTAEHFFLSFYLLALGGDEKGRFFEKNKKYPATIRDSCRR